MEYSQRRLKNITDFKFNSYILNDFLIVDYVPEDVILALLKEDLQDDQFEKRIEEMREIG